LGGMQWRARDSHKIQTTFQRHRLGHSHNTVDAHVIVGSSSIRQTTAGPTPKSSPCSPLSRAGMEKSKPNNRQWKVDCGVTHDPSDATPSPTMFVVVSFLFRKSCLVPRSGERIVAVARVPPALVRMADGWRQNMTCQHPTLPEGSSQLLG